MINYIQSFIAISLGLISAITDFKNMKIYNKNIKKALLISTLIYLISIPTIEVFYIKNYTINLLITLFISLLFYYFKIWAAGDAKLFLAITYMIPYSVYNTNQQNIFPSLHLLIIIFSIAFIYVVIESIYLFLKDKIKNKINLNINISKHTLKEFLTNYFFGYFIILFINNILSHYFNEFLYYNASLIMLCNMLLLIFIYQIISNKKTISKLTILFLILNIIYYIIFGFIFQKINLKVSIIVLVIMLFRYIASRYNYEVIKISNLKSRMILSYSSIMMFYGSKVKGLPQRTTESTDSRLTENEVLSIKRWSKTKKGKENIVIVKHLPFAPFILIGEIIFFILKLYSR